MLLVFFFFLAFLDVSLPCHICPSLGFCRRLKTRGVILIPVSLQEHETSGRTSRSGVTQFCFLSEVKISCWLSEIVCVNEASAYASRN